MARKVYIMSACALALAAGWLWLRPEVLRDIAGGSPPRTLSGEPRGTIPVALPGARSREIRPFRDPNRPGSALARLARPPALREGAGAPSAAGSGTPRPPGRRFRSGKRQYEVREGLYALPEKEVPADLADQVVTTRYGFAFFPLPEDSGALPEGALPVVAQEGRGGYAVLTGKLVVQLKPAAAPASLASDFGVEVVHAVDHLNVAFFKGSGSDVPALLRLLDALRKDDRVDQADLELIEGRVVPQ